MSTLKLNGVPFGQPLGTIDDGPTIQSAINAGFAAGDCLIDVPDGVWNVETPLKLPQVAITTPQPTIVIRGQTPPSRTGSVIGPIARPVAGAVLQCHRGQVGVTPAILSCDGYPGSGPVPLSFVQLVLENIVFRVLGSPTINALDLTLVNAVQARGLVVDTGNYDASAFAWSQNGNYGVLMPNGQGGAYSKIDDLMVIGFETAIRVTDHTHLGYLDVFGCGWAVESQGAGHTVIIERLLDQFNKNGIAIYGQTPITLIHWDMEWDGLRLTDFYDPNNRAVGSARWWATGQPRTFTQVGGTNFDLKPLGTAGPPPPPPNPTASITPHSQTIASGTATLTVASTNGVSATLSPPGNPNPPPLNGTVTVQPSATTTYQYTVNGLPGTAQAQDQATVTIGSPPPPGHALTFDGSTGYVQFGNVLSPGTGNIRFGATITLAVNYAPAFAGLIGKAHYGGEPGRYGLVIDSGKIAALYDAGAGGVEASAPYPNDGLPHTYVGTVDRTAGTITLTIDGASPPAATATFTPDAGTDRQTSDTFYLGCYGNAANTGPGFFAACKISSPFVNAASWPLTEGGGNSVGGTYPGTIVGGVTWS